MLLLEEKLVGAFGTVNIINNYLKMRIKINKRSFFEIIFLFTIKNSLSI